MVNPLECEARQFIYQSWVYAKR